MPTEPFEILVVCTGNICRSPVGHAWLRHELDRRLGDRAGEIVVRSAGTYGLAGWPMEPYAATALSGYGVTDTDWFAASRLDPVVVERAGLVLTATREHRSAVVALVPRAARTAFTMRQFARLAAAVDPELLPETDPATRARLLVAAASEQRGLVAVDPAGDDIADPYGESLQSYERAAAEIVAALRPFVDLLAPLPTEVP